MYDKGDSFFLSVNLYRVSCRLYSDSMNKMTDLLREYVINHDILALRTLPFHHMIMKMIRHFSDP